MFCVGFRCLSKKQRTICLLKRDKQCCVQFIKPVRNRECIYTFPKKGHFDDVPEELMNMFGSGELVTILALDKHDKLANVDKQKLVTALTDEGYYLHASKRRRLVGGTPKVAGTL